MPCEKCWRDAGMRVMLLGGSQCDRYQEILRERKDSPCSKEEQEGTEPSTQGDSNVDKHS